MLDILDEEFNRIIFDDSVESIVLENGDIMVKVKEKFMGDKIILLYGCFDCNAVFNYVVGDEGLGPCRDCGGKLERVKSLSPDQIYDVEETVFRMLKSFTMFKYLGYDFEKHEFYRRMDEENNGS